MNDVVNHPKHYTLHPSGVECIDLIEWLPANLANAVKYLWRKDLKADELEDLKKAAWYINREYHRAASDPGVWGWYIPSEVHRMYLNWKSHESSGYRKEVIERIWMASTPDDLPDAADLLAEPISEIELETNK